MSRIDKATFEEYLGSVITETDQVSRAMNYSLMAPGKRIRPLLLLNALDDLQYSSIQDAYPIAAALEMIHTYSLIHDDLPAMDNDDLRRGQLTCHKKFGEAQAILAGDGLLTKAFEMISNSKLSDNVKTEITAAVSRAAGHQGMILGQLMDLEAENTKINQEQLEKLDGLKTGQLLTVPFICAAIIASRPELIQTFTAIGGKIGLVFQIQDDILDVTASQQQLGKSTSDQINNKATYVSILGLNKAQELVVKINDDITSLFEKLPTTMPAIKQLIDSLKNRSF
jgi:geranylgeranyl diphosphate synthase type II